MCASLASSWALNLVVRRMTRLYRRWRASRSTDTTIVLSILSLTTRPTLIFRLPCTCWMVSVIWRDLRRSGAACAPGAPFHLDRHDPGDRPTGLGDAAVVLELAGRQGEARLPQLLLRVPERRLELHVRQGAHLIGVPRSPPRRLPGRSPAWRPGACDRPGASPRPLPRAR